MNKIKLITSISIIILLSGCVNAPNKENASVPTPSVPTITSTSTVTSVPTTKIPVISPIIYNDANDLAPKEAKNYTYVDFLNTESKPTSDNVLINVSITAKLGTMIEIKDKKDIGCLDVINKNRGIEMPSGRYQYYLKCSEPMDTKSAIVTITNPDQYQAVSYMIKIETTEI